MAELLLWIISKIYEKIVDDFKLVRCVPYDVCVPQVRLCDQENRVNLSIVDVFDTAA